MNLYDEVAFYYRFKRNKIVECTGFIKSEERNEVSSIEMDENDVFESDDANENEQD